MDRVDRLARCAIALGSNLGDRRAHLEWAIGQLSSHLAHIHTSSFVDTEPVDVPDAQPRYLNAALVGDTALDPLALLDVLLTLERARGRVRPSARAARTLDLDLVLWGDRIVRTPVLDLPHPRFRERRFVLAPLAEIAPDMQDPVTGLTVQELLDRLR